MSYGALFLTSRSHFGVVSCTEVTHARLWPHAVPVIAVGGGNVLQNTAIPQKAKNDGDCWTGKVSGSSENWLFHMLSELKR